MKMFLASYRFGLHVDRFLSLTGGPGRIAVVASAADSWPPAARASAVETEFRALRELGFDPHELDLRHYVGRPDRTASELDRFESIWVRGGNTFVLRAQLRRTGADDIIARRVRDGSLTYAGYSAGACVCSTSLRGIEAADDPAEVTPTTGSDVVWDGLDLIRFALIPHFGSILDEAGAAASMVSRYEQEGEPFETLTDDQAVLVDGDRLLVL